MDEIRYPNRPSEAEIQATLWLTLKDKGIDARLEVPTSLNSRKHILDIVIFKNQTPQSIIECKSWSKVYSKERQYQLSKNTKQIRKYESWGLPVLVCGRPEAIPIVVEMVLSNINHSNFEHI